VGAEVLDDVTPKSSVTDFERRRKETSNVDAGTTKACVNEDAFTVYGANRYTGNKEDGGTVFVGMGVDKIVHCTKKEDKELLLRRFHRTDLMKSILRVGIRELLRELKKMRDEKETHLLNKLVSSFQDKTSLKLMVILLNYVRDPYIRSQAALRLCLGHGNKQLIKFLYKDLRGNSNEKGTHMKNTLSVLQHLRSKCDLDFKDDDLEKHVDENYDAGFIKESDFKNFFKHVGLKKVKTEKKENTEIQQTGYKIIKATDFKKDEEKIPKENYQMREHFVKPALTGASRSVSLCSKESSQMNVKSLVKYLRGIVNSYVSDLPPIRTLKCERDSIRNRYVPH